jgi:hypothetical protein
MQTENVNINTPVQVQSDCKARVALDLMRRVSAEEGTKPDLMKNRLYWLTLYRQCYMAANGEDLKYILEVK